MLPLSLLILDVLNTANDYAEVIIGDQLLVYDGSAFTSYTLDFGGLDNDEVISRVIAGDINSSVTSTLSDNDVAFPTDETLEIIVEVVDMPEVGITDTNDYQSVYYVFSLLDAQGDTFFSDNYNDPEGDNNLDYIRRIESSLADHKLIEIDQDNDGTADESIVPTKAFLLADLNSNNEQLELIISDYNSIAILRDQRLGLDVSSTNQPDHTVISNMVAANLYDDGVASTSETAEIVSLQWDENGENSYLAIYQYEGDSAFQQGTSEETYIQLTDVLPAFGVAPVIADVDNDNDLDIVAAFRDVIYVFYNAGTGNFSLSNTTALNIEGTPQQLIVTDFDGDEGSLEVIANVGGLIYAFELDGNHMVGWPKYIHGSSDVTLVADIEDGDNANNAGPELIISNAEDTNDYKRVFAFTSNGLLAENWPETPVTSAIIDGGISISMGDLDGDGDAEMLMLYDQDESDTTMTLEVIQTEAESDDNHLLWPLGGFNAANNPYVDLSFTEIDDPVSTSIVDVTEQTATQLTGLTTTNLGSYDTNIYYLGGFVQAPIRGGKNISEDL